MPGTIFRLYVLGTMLAAGPCISAQITLANSDSLATATGNTDPLSFTVQNNTNRTLVVSVAGESDLLSGVTFDGNAMTQIALGQESNFQHASIWYLDLADTGATITGDIAVSYSGGNTGSITLGAYDLFNVQSGGAVATDSDSNQTDSPTTLSLDLGTASAGDYVIQAAVSNGDGTITSPGKITNLIYTDDGAFGINGRGYQGLSGYEAIGVAGAINDTYNLASGSSRHALAGARFVAVPKPSSLVLCGIALGLMIFLRRKI